MMMYVPCIGSTDCIRGDFGDFVWLCSLNVTNGAHFHQHRRDMVVLTCT
jgi:hypothetical protein